MQRPRGQHHLLFSITYNNFPSVFTDFSSCLYFKDVCTSVRYTHRSTLLCVVFSNGNSSTVANQSPATVVLFHVHTHSALLCPRCLCLQGCLSCSYPPFMCFQSFAQPSPVYAGLICCKGCNRRGYRPVWSSLPQQDTSSCRRTNKNEHHHSPTPPTYLPLFCASSLLLHSKALLLTSLFCGFVRSVLVRISARRQHSVVCQHLMHGTQHSACCSVSLPSMRAGSRTLEHALRFELVLTFRANLRDTGHKIHHTCPTKHPCPPPFA